MPIPMKVNSLVLNPTPPDQVTANSIFVDSTNANVLKSKDNSNSSGNLGTGGSTDVMTKVMQNLSGGSIPAGTPVAKRTNGAIDPAEASPSGDQIIIGVTTVTITNNATGAVALIGPNVPGVLTGLGFVPGDPVYLKDGGGYTKLISDLTNTDAIIRIGYADCAAGNASGVATDLIMFAEVISS